MIVFLVIVLIAVITINAVYAASHRKSIDLLTDRINGMVNETMSLRNEIKKLVDKQAGPVPTPVQKPQPEKTVPPPQVVREIPKPAPPVVQQTPVMPKPVTRQPQPVYTEPDNWFTTWLKNNPDLEKFIGENLINKIGIGVLVLGISFLVKYAIGRNWVSEVGRVSIGLLCGVLLILFAHRLRNSYRSFSSVLAGGSIAVFYFTIAFAFHQYNLIGQTAAFVLMIVITAFAVLLSLLYNRLELAVIATVGGFLTPFMVSTGEGNYIVLFTYLIILNTGLLLLSYFKRWPSINIIAFFFTVLIYGGWLSSVLIDNNPRVSYSLALLFATVFYLIFLGMNMLYQVKNKLVFKAIDFSILLLLNATYYAAGMLLLDEIESGKYQGLFTLSVGVVNLALAWYFFRRQNTDRNFLYLLIGLTLTFLSLTIPIQLEGHAITMFWSAEFVLLFWLYQRSRIQIFQYASLLVAVLAAGSLFMDWEQAVGESQHLVLIFTGIKGIVTNLVAVVAFVVYALLLDREKEDLPLQMPPLGLKRLAWVAATVILYMTCIYGVNLYFKELDSYSIPNIYHRLITTLFVLGYYIWLQKRHTGASAFLHTGALMIYLSYHVFSFGMTSEVRDEVLLTNNGWQHLVFHWVGVGIAVYLMYYTIRQFRASAKPFISVNRFSWLMSIAAILFLSLELMQLFVVVGFRPDNIYYLEEQYNKGGLSIVWAVSSFALMWLGMHYRNKTLRIISLTLFAIVLIKLFFADLVGISEAGKIVAFILLGVLLLTVSFMYQRLKKIIIDDVKE